MIVRGTSRDIEHHECAGCSSIVRTLKEEHSEEPTRKRQTLTSDRTEAFLSRRIPTSLVEDVMMRLVPLWFHVLTIFVTWLFVRWLRWYACRTRRQSCVDNRPWTIRDTRLSFKSVWHLYRPSSQWIDATDNFCQHPYHRWWYTWKCGRSCTGPG